MGAWPLCLLCLLCLQLQLRVAGFSILLLLCACSKADSEPSVSSANGFSLKDYLCLITPSECHSDVFQKLYLAPPDAVHETTLEGKKLRIPMGYVDPIQLMTPGGDGKSVFMQALGPDLQARTPQNLKEFIRPPFNNLVRFNLKTPAAGLDYQNWWLTRATADHIKATKLGFMAIKRYPDMHGLEHWGNDYVRIPSYKPCEYEGEMHGCGMGGSQDDLYLPFQPNGPPSYMTCDSWLFKDHVDAEMAMSEIEREAYYKSDAYRKPGWRQHVNPYCHHHMYYAPLNAAVVLFYRRGLLPHWRQMEDRTRAILDATLSVVPVASSTEAPR